MFSKNNNKNKVEIRNIPQVPGKFDFDEGDSQSLYRTVLPKDLDKQGNLKVEEQGIDAIKALVPSLESAYISKAKIQAYGRSTHNPKLTEFKFSCLQLMVKGQPHYFVEYPKLLLGEGKFGKVKCIYEPATKKWHAIKKVFLDEENANHIMNAQKEHHMLVEMAASLDHEELIHLGKAASKSNINSLKRYLIVMNYIDGFNLQTIIDSVSDNGAGRITLSPIMQLLVAIDMAKSARDVAELGFVHRDIKPDNFICNLTHLLDGTRLATLVDHGFTIEKSKGSSSPNLFGSPIFFAPALKEDLKKLLTPETLRKKILSAPVEKKFSYSEQTDMHSLGVSLAQLFGLFDENLIKENIAEWELNQSFIVTETDEMFINNKDFPQDILYSVLSLLRQITTSPLSPRLQKYSEKEITSMHEVVETLEGILKDLLNLKSQNKDNNNLKGVRIGLFDIETFNKVGMAGQEKKLEILKALQGKMREGLFDFIVLIDTGAKPRATITYSEIRNKLLENTPKNMSVDYFPLASQVFIHPNLKKIQAAIRMSVGNNAIADCIEFTPVIELSSVQNLKTRRP
ncbi:MAG: protein kinase [Gammaproteobacteria bacterium]|nr:protein kinase [Gammaproteobacteria bacterium]